MIVFGRCSCANPFTPHDWTVPLNSGVGGAVGSVSVDVSMTHGQRAVLRTWLGFVEARARKWFAWLGQAAITMETEHYRLTGNRNYRLDDVETAKVGYGISSLDNILTGVGTQNPLGVTPDGRGFFQSGNFIVAPVSRNELNVMNWRGVDYVVTPSNEVGLTLNSACNNDTLHASIQYSGGGLFVDGSWSETGVSVQDLDLEMFLLAELKLERA